MVDHTIEAHFKVSPSVCVDGKQRAFDDRVVELMAAAIASDPLGRHGGPEAVPLARAIYRAVMAMPVALETARNELHL
jgi:AmiR/NasT family two-component response regulator